MTMHNYLIEIDHPEGATDDDIINNAREAIARAGHQVGDCVLAEQVGNRRTAYIQIDLLDLTTHFAKVSFECNGYTVQLEMGDEDFEDDTRRPPVSTALLPPYEAIVAAAKVEKKPEPRMRVFIANYYWYGKYSAYQNYHATIVAETESVALGLVLEKYATTDAKEWSFEEVDLETAKVYEGPESSN